MDALELLRQDHKRIRMLFSMLEQQGQAMMGAATTSNDGSSPKVSGDGSRPPVTSTSATAMSGANRRQDSTMEMAMDGMGSIGVAQPGMGSLLGELSKELSLHAVIEEQNFYPALASMSQLSELVKDSYHDHADMKIMLGQLVLLEPTDPTMIQQLQQLRQTVETHVAEEENELFAQLEQTMPIVERHSLGLQLEQAKAINLPGVLTSLPAQMVQVMQIASGEAAMPVPGGLSNLLLSRYVATAGIGDYAAEMDTQAQDMIATGQS